MQGALVIHKIGRKCPAPTLLRHLILSEPTQRVHRKKAGENCASVASAVDSDDTRLIDPDLIRDRTSAANLYACGVEDPS